jgi:hypothetical protein
MGICFRQKNDEGHVIDKKGLRRLFCQSDLQLFTFDLLFGDDS